MSELAEVIIQTFSNLIKLNDKEISIVFDDNNKIWFSLRDVFKALDYKDIKKEIKRFDIDEVHLSQFNKLKITHMHNDRKRHPHSVMIDESGIYKLLDKSTKPIAKKFRDALFNDILSNLREKGEYKFTNKYKQKLNQINKTLKHLKTEFRRSKQTKYSNKTGSGFIYILKVKTSIDGKEKKCYKIGYTTDLEKRLATYKTGNPDVELAHHENVNCNSKQLEDCVLNLNILKKLSIKNEIICNESLKDIKAEIKDCKKLISKYSNK